MKGQKLIKSGGGGVGGEGVGMWSVVEIARQGKILSLGDHSVVGKASERKHWRPDRTCSMGRMGKWK